ncbi:MAG: S8 family peptidase [Bacteroidetes bacterium]|nr:S8 family peptidase [Bacteroidota bacterium]
MRFVLLIFIALITLVANAQQNFYVVTFKDKNNSTYTISHPEEFLSQKAIERRQRQKIKINSTDLPITYFYKKSIEDLGIKIRLEVKWFNAVVIQTTPDKLNSIQTLSCVAKIESLGPLPTYKSGNIKTLFKNETLTNLFTKKSSQAVDYGMAKSQIEQINGNLLHNQGYLGQGMTIAVLDDGFKNLYDLSVFDNLRKSGHLKGVKDFSKNGNFLTSLDDSHGTEVLSLLTGNLNSTQIGTAPEADYWLIRTEDAKAEYPLEEYNWAAGAIFADSVGVDIISSSLGYFEFDSPYASSNYTIDQLNGKTTLISRAAEKATERGILVVNAAGNEGTTKWKKIIAPADVDSVLTVGAVNTAGTSASFSSYGPSADGRIKPDIAATGYGTVLANPSTNTLITGNGTSFSTPLIAGLCACLWQGNPSASNYDLLKALRITASKSSTPTDQMGFGIANFYKAHLFLKKKEKVIASKPSFIVTPNPSKDKFDLIIMNNSILDWTIEIYSISGKLIERQTHIIPEKTISIGDTLKSGIYLLRVMGGSEMAIEKIIKG